MKNTIVFLFLLFAIVACNDVEQVDRNAPSEEAIYSLLQSYGVNTDSLIFKGVESGELKNFSILAEYSAKHNLPFQFHPRPDGRLMPDEEFRENMKLIKGLALSKPYQNERKVLIEQFKEELAKLEEQRYREVEQLSRTRATEQQIINVDSIATVREFELTDHYERLLNKNSNSFNQELQEAIDDR